MRRNILKLLSCLLILNLSIFVSTDVFSASWTWPQKGSAGVQPFAFLKNGAGARAIGMGKAYIAIADDVDAGYWNPAGLSNLKTVGINAMSSDLYGLGIYYNYLGIGATIPSSSADRNFGSAALSVIRLDVGDMQEYDADGNKIEGSVFKDVETAIFISYGIRFAANIAVGANLKYIMQSIYKYSGWGIGADLGVLYSPVKGLSLGLVLQDIIPPEIKLRDVGEVSRASLKVRTGASYAIPLSGNFKWLFAIGVDLPVKEFTTSGSSYQALKGYLGTEFDMNILKIRAGSDNGKINAGAGLAIDIWRVDYAFVWHPDLGVSHIVSLGANL